MSETKLIALDALRDFLTWAKDRYTHRIALHGGRCETCGYSGYSVTVGYETNFDAMFENLEADIDEFSETFRDRD
jgi:hypothetical protein